MGGTFSLTFSEALYFRIEGNENMEILPRYTGEPQTREEALAEAYKARLVFTVLRRCYFTTIIL